MRQLQITILQTVIGVVLLGCNSRSDSTAPAEATDSSADQQSSVVELAEPQHPESIPASAEAITLFEKQLAEHPFEVLRRPTAGQVSRQSFRVDQKVTTLDVRNVEIEDPASVQWFLGAAQMPTAPDVWLSIGVHFRKSVRDDSTSVYCEFRLQPPEDARPLPVTFVMDGRRATFSASNARMIVHPPPARAPSAEVADAVKALAAMVGQSRSECKVRLDLSQLEQILSAKSLSCRIGSKSFEFSERQLEFFHTLLAEIEAAKDATPDDLSNWLSVEKQRQLAEWPKGER